ncbi:MAG: hypothetical protein COZ06_16015 [Armatimonadetes bacterium CG_4_10_14_3_um_filter_66_18]|nr:hypothetical protein [Armatimonadota bacterium]PIU92872.1 MAG: hypothetical protein COS65_15650 [Armatimonadetes bacterium CG06_land_8_20_14_3_00_66_21]PIX41980.1 MAG: hypothetical protein COZ57_22210 [Armatimonadetes bacterium CG_4_8_14_3_um_filter_66_20]PIY48598.1 MAG: hypothetical protein COZ06_16015 [Armatimonadetes bacterium CG_4_10_14_3_um_filter_66_18]PIZ50783.1 MAG: hypothetical protein COY42_01130 [Armatimonadetes bacterium CG_4_10_14_0_8_um_filter_66_14]
MTVPLFAGAAKATITPPVGIDMGGYGGRPGPAAGVHDELEAAALCLHGDSTVMLLTADLVGLDRATVVEVRRGIEEATGCPAANVMLTCSHTHAGPAMPCIRSLGEPDAAYLAELKRTLAAIAQLAWERREPALARASRVPLVFGMNRRDGNRAAAASDNVDRGTVQPHVEVLRVEEASGSPLAVWMCYSAHPVTLREYNLLFSADWVGYARTTVERRLPGAVVLFAQGCCGNTVSWPHDGTYEECERQGRTFGEAVCATPRPTCESGTHHVACASEALQLPLLDPPPVAQARAILAQCRAARDERWEEANYGWRQLLAGDVDWAERVRAAAETGATNLTVDYEVQVVRLGDFAVVGLDGEVFVEYALNLHRGSPFAQTAVTAYSNGNVGYVPTAAAFAAGGYEVETAIRYYRTLMLKPDCERLILESATRLLARLHHG